MGKLKEQYSVIDNIIIPRMKQGWVFKDPKKPDEKREPRNFTKDQIRDYERRVSRSDSLLFHVELIQCLKIKNTGYKEKISKLSNENKLLKAELDNVKEKIKYLEDRLEKQQI
jgi:hypothetical protein